MKSRLLIILLFCLCLSILACSSLPLPGRTPIASPSVTVTQKPSATIRPTITATFTPLPPTAQDEMENGSVRFIDRAGGYELIFSQDWLIWDAVAEEYGDYVIRLENDYPKYVEQFSQVDTMFGEDLRVAAINIKPANIPRTSFVGVGVEYLDDLNLTGMPTEEFLEDVAEYVETQSGVEVLEKRADKTGNGVNFVEVHAKRRWVHRGEFETLYQYHVFIRTHNGLVIMMLTAPFGYLDEVIDPFNDVLQSFSITVNQISYFFSSPQIPVIN